MISQRIAQEAGAPSPPANASSTALADSEGDTLAGTAANTIFNGLPLMRGLT